MEVKTAAPSGKLSYVMNATWRPLGFKVADMNLFDALHDGVPAWMEKSLDAWNQEVLEIALYDDEEETGSLRRFYKIERELRMSMREPKNSEVSTLAAAVRAHFRSRDSELILTDYLLSKADRETVSRWCTGADEPQDTTVDRLEHFSGVQVRNGRWG